MNYFSQLPVRLQHQQLSNISLISKSELTNGKSALEGKKIVIVGCGSQGLNQGLNLRDSGLDVSYALREQSIKEERQSYKDAKKHNFNVNNYETLIPLADLVINLTPDKQHTNVIKSIMPLMKKNSILSYSHGFNIVEENIKIREDITVIMIAPKGPGTEVRTEYEKGFCVPTLIAVHSENDPQKQGLEFAKAYAVGLGANRAGIIHATFSSEVKSDLMGEQTVLCGLVQSATLLAFDKMLTNGIKESYACKLVQQGWETITEALKHGGITNMMNRLSNPAKIKAYQISKELKDLMRSLFTNHMDNILSGKFSQDMIQDWKNNDDKLLTWREKTNQTAFENASAQSEDIPEQEYFDNSTLLVGLIKAGVELAFETMTQAGIAPEIAYYESLHELPLIANLVSRKKLYEMNKVISDTAEYGCYLFDNQGRKLLSSYFDKAEDNLIGKNFNSNNDNSVDNQELIKVNEGIYKHPIEIVGRKLRSYMTDMKALKKN